MTTYAALRFSDPSRGAFERALESLRENGLVEPGSGGIPEWGVRPLADYDYREAFGMASAFLRGHIKCTAGVTVLVDEVDVATFSATGSKTWSGLLAMLVLAFPEARWAFLLIKNSPVGPDGPPAEGVRHWLTESYGLAALLKRQGTPIFDGYGLRSWVRERTLRDLDKAFSEHGEHPSDRLRRGPIRSKVAVTLDDEPDFRNFEALMAYNRGFRVHSVESWSEAERLLGKGGLLLQAGEEGSGPEATVGAGDLPDVGGEFLLSIEDLYLNFPDQELRGMSNLKLREDELPALSQSSPPCRRFVSVGHEVSDRPEEYEERKAYLRRRRDEESRALRVRPRPGQQLVYKPAPGLYALWLELGLDRVFRQGKVTDGERGLALGFAWPVRWASGPRPPEKQARGKREHSAPGQLLEIAQSLLDRTPADVSGAGKLLDAVVCAVRATDALELLAGKTPTLSLDALSLKHIYEVQATCQFVGVEYHWDISERLKDIRTSLAALSVWLHPTRKRAFVLNGEARILTRLVEILEQFGQFEEAVVCRTRLASLHAQLELLSNMRHMSVGGILLWPAHVYAGWALRSLLHYWCATVVSILIFMTGFVILGAPEGFDAAKALDATLKAMFVISIPDKPLHLVILGYCVAIFGVLNFGLLVTYLYSTLKRL